MFKENQQHYFTDERYTITLEFCGYPEQRYVVRFCNEFVSSHKIAIHAMTASRKHARNRGYKLTSKKG